MRLIWNYWESSDTQIFIHSVYYNLLRNKLSLIIQYINRKNLIGDTKNDLYVIERFQIERLLEDGQKGE